MTYQHVEAFCLMTYQTDDGTEREVLWNSRDGVTPFVIPSRSGKPMTHVDWQNDRCVPEHKPVPGDRIFVDAPLPRRARRHGGWPHGEPEPAIAIVSPDAEEATQ